VSVEADTRHEGPREDDPLWVCGQWSAFADLRMSAEADTRHERPREDDFNRLDDVRALVRQKLGLP